MYHELPSLDAMVLASVKWGFFEKRHAKGRQSFEEGKQDKTKWKLRSGGENYSCTGRVWSWKLSRTDL